MADIKNRRKTMHTYLQKEALWKSAQHYLENWQDIYTANIGSSACPCCRGWANNDCVGCPIMQHTGKADCEGTPWHDVYDVRRKYLAATEEVQDRLEGEVQNLLEEEYRFLVELALEPYSEMGLPTVQFQEGDYIPYVVIHGQEEVDRFDTRWAANRCCRMLIEEIQDDGGAL